jgi:SAM-dependent methyltransferase
MTDQGAVTAAEIARLAGVGRAAVSNWRRRYQDFPKPVGGTETSPTFALADIQGWLQGVGKLGVHSVRELLWQQLESAAAADRRPVADVVAAAGAYLAGRSASKVLTAQTRRALDELAAREGVENAFERIFERFTESHARQLAVTPPELAELIVELAGEPTGMVVDPACGTGSLLRAILRCAGSIYGQEIDGSLAALATARLAFRDANVLIRAGDSLRADAFKGVEADAVVCNPPFSQRNWGFEELQYDARWAYGMPPKGESELAWVQHCLAHLRPGGRAVLVMPPSVASRRSGRPIRAELLRSGALRAVIALPAGAAPPLGLPMQLWVLERPTEPVGVSSLLLIDTTAGTPGRIDDLGWAVISERVRSACLSLEDSTVAADDAVYRVVPVIELLDDEVDLTPARQVRVAPDLSGIADTRRSLSGLLSALPGLLPEVMPVSAESGQRAVTSIGALARSGALMLRQQTSRWDVRGAGEGFPVLTAHDVVTGQSPSGRLPEAEDEPIESIRVRAGDVVVPVVAPRPTAVVIGAGGALLGPNLYLLRPDPELLDPWFLVGFLRSQEVLRVASSMSGAHRLDVRRLEVPRLPLDEQRRYGETFRRLAEFERIVGQAAALGQVLTRSLTDGLAVGVLEPVVDRTGVCRNARTTIADR